MPTPIESAVRLAQRTVFALAGESALYRWRLADGSYLSLPVNAVKSEEDVELETGDGTLTTARVTMFRISADELIPYGAAARPKAGDRIEWIAGGRRQVYELMNLAGENCYEPTDPYASGYKCHTKLVEES